MATLMELMRPNPSKGGGAPEWCIKAAFALGVPSDELLCRVKRYGLGQIYATSGLVMPDTPRLRGKMVKNFGTVIVIDKNGYVFIRTEANTGRLNAIKHKKQYGMERKEMREDMKNRAEAHRREVMFNDGKGESVRKHGGKGNENGDIGKYVPFSCPKLNDYGSKRKNMFARI